MKKIMALLLALAMVFTFAACGETKTETPETDTDTTKTEGESEVKWKDIMGTVEKNPGVRVVIFQNLDKFDTTVEEFASFGEPPVETDGEVAIAILEKIWTYGTEGEMRILDAEGNETKITASDLAAATVKTEEDGTGTFKSGSVEVKNFKYLITEKHEALMFVDPEETVTMPDMFKTLGYEETKNVIATASDGFWCLTDNTTETDGSEIRGLLSGGVNCNLTVEGKGGAGKINDILIIDIVE